ncbi:hypothetical protein U9M48_040593 [Paspalum notatum var. saurae]|uniref:F-box domain-containing protein n=1 Tax=Paspalum notatum var. saurae TaxID=547442 RepID=A0AAQ3UND3_PASNO
MNMMMEPTTSRPPPPADEDIISKLPGDVLVLVLEKLNLRDAVRVGVLSRRWRCLIPNQLPRLHLDIKDFLPDDHQGGFYDHDDGQSEDDDDQDDGQEEYDDMPDYQDAGDGYDDHEDDSQVEDDREDDGQVEEEEEEEEDMPDDHDDHEDDGQVEEEEDDMPDDHDGEDYYRDVLSEAGDKMVDAAAALLASRQAAGVGVGDQFGGVRTTLAMRFFLRHNYMSLGRLLDGAVAGGKVSAAELTVSTTCRLDRDDHHETERALAGYGRRFRALFDACLAAFGALTWLTVEKMRHATCDLRDILTTCTRLEKLSLSQCGPAHGKIWQVRHARLTDITIYLCSMYGVDFIWLPRLERLTFQGWFWTTNKLVSFGHVPRLTTVTLSNDDDCNGDQTLQLSHIFANTSISDLRLNFRGSNIWVQPESPRRLTDIFCNLKNLKIRNVHEECGLTWIMFLLQSALHLQELYIKLMGHDCSEGTRKKVPWEMDTSFKHSSLAKVTIIGFYNTQETTIVTFIHHLVEAAVNLEEIYIREDATASLCEVCGYAQHDGSRFPRTDEDKDTFRKRINDDGRSTTTTFKMHIQPMST